MNDPFAHGLLLRLPEPPRKVVLLRASRIGDFVCTTPAFRAFRAALPRAEISLITLPHLRDLAERLTSINRVIDFPGFPGIAEQLFDARRTACFFQRMQAEEFDLAVQMQGSGQNSNPFMLMLGAGLTAGFVRPGDPAGRLDAALPLPQSGHEVKRLMAMPAFLGASGQSPDTEFPLRPDDRLAAEGLLAGADPPLIGLHTSARDLTRRWPLDRFAETGVELHRRHGGTIVVIGEGEDRGAVEAEAHKADLRCLNLAGMTSLPTLGGVIARLSLLVTNDTGPAHIAYALGTPAVVIFGGSDPSRYGPPGDGPHRALAYEVPCRPCSYASCPIDNLCLEQVPVEQVLTAAGRLLQGHAARTPHCSDGVSMETCGATPHCSDGPAGVVKLPRAETRPQGNRIGREFALSQG